jgi:hypothetical protein
MFVQSEPHHYASFRYSLRSRPRPLLHAADLPVDPPLVVVTQYRLTYPSSTDIQSALTTVQSCRLRVVTRAEVFFWLSSHEINLRFVTLAAMNASKLQILGSVSKRPPVLDAHSPARDVPPAFVSSRLNVPIAGPSKVLSMCAL